MIQTPKQNQSCQCKSISEWTEKCFLAAQINIEIKRDLECVKCCQLTMCTSGGPEDDWGMLNIQTHGV